MKVIKDAEFAAEVTQSKTPVLVDFFAAWCGPCRQMSPVLDEISKEFDGKVKVVKMDIDESPATPSAFNVRSIPTLVVFKDGKPAGTKVGAMPKSALVEWLKGF